MNPPIVMEPGTQRGRWSNVTHTWFVRDGAAVSARVDEPHDEWASAAVVLVPALARERVVSFRTMRALAIRCARRGIVAVSISPSGTGASAPLSEDADLVETWLADVEAARELARHIVGDRPVHVVGLRLGGALVNHLPHPAPGEVHLLWEPVGGAQFIRQQRNLRRYAIPQPVVEDGVELYGLHLSTAHAEQLKRLAAPRRQGTPAEGTVVRFEEDRDVANRIATVSPHYAVIPYQSLDAIVDSLPVAEAGVVNTWSPVQTIDLTVHGRPVRETVCTVGDHRLHGVLTRRHDSVATQQPLSGRGILFTAMGVDQLDGPGDLWVTTSRELAAEGVTCLRTDRRQMGEHVDVEQPTEPAAYLTSSVEDVSAGIRALATFEDRENAVAAVGVCAGAWSLLGAAPTAPVQTVLSVNSLHWDPDQDHYDAAFYDRFHGVESQFLRDLVEERLQRAQLRTAGDGALVRRRLEASSKRALTRYAPGIKASLQGIRSPARVHALVGPVPDRTRVELVMGTAEEVLFKANKGPSAVRRFSRRGGRIDVRINSVLDHSLLSEGARRVLKTEIHRVLDGLDPGLEGA